ncbi:Fanconi anemia group E protein [Protopterus annectens]|uniref:Fanconi anemia group E protein n=1 Tax=Protopterus annectens TaxID=7888 RepID=UPI001CFB6293|nr:Fanconi anemia group E protein [Protopterus annectens]
MEEHRAVLVKFDKAYHPVLHVLMSSSIGAVTAFHMLQRTQSCDILSQQFHWKNFFEALCRDEPFLEGQAQTLVLKPLFHLLPQMCKRNLLSLVHLAHHMVPKDCLQNLIEMVEQDSNPQPWIKAHVLMLKRFLDTRSLGWTLWMLTPECQEHLNSLCKKITDDAQGSNGPGTKLGWVNDEKQVIVSSATCSESSDTAMSQKSKKRKSETSDIYDFLSPEETEVQDVKKFKLTEDSVELFVEKCTPPLEAKGKGGTDGAGKEHDAPDADPEASSEGQGSSYKEAGLHLPENLVSCLPKLRDLLETEADTAELNPPPEFQVLNECSAEQLTVLCSLLHISDMCELMLPQLCARLTALVPELGYSNAAFLAQALFLNKILCLTEPASRFLVTALASFCLKYTHPTCSALIGPILQASEKGSFQMELICRLIEDCLEQEHLLLIFGYVLDVSWCEELLSVVQSLLDKKMELTPEVFDRFIGKLNAEASDFMKSVKYAKLFLAVLTKYQGHITVVHKNSLSCALAANGTFLKKSLQAALKRITPA